MRSSISLMNIFSRNTAVTAVFFCLALFLISASVSAQAPVVFRVGERITYTVSLDRFKNVAYAETFVESYGRLGDKDAVELRGKMKTLDFVSAAFYSIDESRTTFASAETGLPLYIVKNENIGGLPKETIYNFLTVPTANADLLTLVYRIRAAAGSGAFNLQENDKNYAVTFQSTTQERVKTDAGEYDTSIVTVQSDYFTEHGIKDVRVNLSADENRVPVMIRFKTSRGEFRAAASSISIVEPEIEAQPTPTPVMVPRPNPTPRPQATPTPYIDNEPLAPELAFDLGETLTYQISSGMGPVASFQLQAKERRQVMGIDSLLLTATVTSVRPGVQVFSVNDQITAQVDPLTLAPQQIDIKFNGGLSSYNRTARFDQNGNAVTYNGTNRVDAPVGTQSILSLIYAVRSFNLKPSRNSANPVNDTRVAVFWDTQPYIFTLRPSPADLITQKGEAVSAQLITVSTGNPLLDSLQIKIWLSNDERRVPLRISTGAYTADLISETQVIPK